MSLNALQLDCTTHQFIPRVLCTHLNVRACRQLPFLTTQAISFPQDFKERASRVITHQMCQSVPIGKRCCSPSSPSFLWLLPPKGLHTQRWFLAKPSKIPDLNPPHQAHWPHPQVPHLHGSQTPSGMGTSPLPGHPVPASHQPFRERIPCNIQPEIAELILARTAQSSTLLLNVAHTKSLRQSHTAMLLGVR